MASSGRSWGSEVGFFKRREKEIKDTSDDVVGGFAFFLSLALLFPTGLLLLALAIRQVRQADISNVVIFLAALALGASFAHRFMQGHLSVLIHEWKHELISSLVGNKNKRMEVGRDTGSLQYEYTKKTAHFNAFIALAPYIVPIFTFVGILITAALGSKHQSIALMIIGATYGADALLNARDISPVQTDISLIRGGYSIGLLYIISWNMLTTAIVLAWAFQGFNGVAELFTTVMLLFIALYSTITGWQPGS